MRSIRVPQDRVGAIIGPKGSTKRQIQKISGIKIDIDTEEGEILIHDEAELADPLMALKIMDVIKAIGRGFSPERAFRLFDDDEYLEIVDLKEFVGGRNNQLTRIRGRLIGQNGKTRRIIEDLTGVDANAGFNPIFFSNRFGTMVSDTHTNPHLRQNHSRILRMNIFKIKAYQTFFKF